LSNNKTYLSISLHSRRKSIAFYSRLMAITRSDELRHSSAARDTKSSSRVIAIIICSLNNVLLNDKIMDLLLTGIISHLINVDENN
jgi:hypothetical protein